MSQVLVLFKRRKVSVGKEENSNAEKGNLVFLCFFLIHVTFGKFANFANNTIGRLLSTFTNGLKYTFRIITTGAVFFVATVNIFDLLTSLMIPQN